MPLPADAADVLNVRPRVKHFNKTCVLRVRASAEEKERGRESERGRRRERGGDGEIEREGRSVCLCAHKAIVCPSRRIRNYKQHAPLGAGLAKEVVQPTQNRRWRMNRVVYNQTYK